MMTTTTSDVQRERAVLAGLESKLSDALDRRDKTIQEISRASAEAETSGVNSASNGARRPINSARNSLAPLNRLAKSIDSEIGLIRIQVTHARRMLELAEAHADTARAKAAVPIAEGAERLFLVNTPHHLHQVRHRAPSIEALRSRLLPGYTIEGEIFGANDDGSGGVVAAINPTGPSIMKGLLLAHGPELLEYLAQHGISGTGKQAVVVLPTNNRELQ
jgi:hypothetical protein